MTTTPKTIKVTKQGRHNNIYVCYDQIDAFGKTLKRKVLFDSCCDYELTNKLEQAENLKHVY